MAWGEEPTAAALKYYNDMHLIKKYFGQESNWKIFEEKSVNWSKNLNLTLLLLPPLNPFFFFTFLVVVVVAVAIIVLYIKLISVT